MEKLKILLELFNNLKTPMGVAVLALLVALSVMLVELSLIWIRGG